VKVTTLYVAGDGSQYLPHGRTQRSKDDPQFFSGDIWLWMDGSCSGASSWMATAGTARWPCRCRRLRVARGRVERTWRAAIGLMAAACSGNGGDFWGRRAGGTPAGGASGPELKHPNAAAQTR